MKLEYMTRMELILPPSVIPFRVTLDEPLTDWLLLQISEQNRLFHVEREPDGSLSVRRIGDWRAAGVSSNLGGTLWDWAKKDGRGWALVNTGFYLKDGSMRGARWSWISKERLGREGLKREPGFARACPEFVAEVLANNYSREEMQARMRMWIENGVELGLMADPERKVVEIYRQGREVEVVADRVVGDGVMAGFALELSKIWE